MSIKLPDNNIYANDNSVLIRTQDNELRLVRTPMIIPPDELDKFVIIKDNDQLTIIAWNAYKEFVDDASKYWFILSDANPQIRNVVKLKQYAGQNLRIPDFNRVRLLF